MVQDIIKNLEAGEHKATHDFEVSTLAERGTRLAMGRLVGNGVVGEFAFKKPTIEVDLEIAAVKADPEFKNFPGRLVTAILGTSLAMLNSKDFSKLSPFERQIEVGELPFVDVIHLALYRAWQCGRLGRRLMLGRPFACAKCGEIIRDICLDAEKGAIPAWSWEAKTPIRSVIKLHQSLTLGQRTTDSLVFAPPTWKKAVWGLTSAQFEMPVVVDHAIALAAIVAGSDGQEGGFWAVQPASVFSDMSSEDGELMREAVRQIGGNINPYVPFSCGCGHVMRMPIGLRELDVGF